MFVSRFIHAIRLYRENGLCSFVERILLYKTWYIMSLHKRAIINCASRFSYTCLSEKITFSAILWYFTIFSSLIVTSLFFNEVQKIFLPKWSAKKALQSMIEEKVFYTLSVFLRLAIHGNTLRASYRWSRPYIRLEKILAHRILGISSL
jgi:hypothetical protein